MGDLSSKHGKLDIPSTGASKVMYTDTNLPLSGAWSVADRSIVVHAANGGSARLDCGTIEEYSEYKTATAVFDNWTRAVECFILNRSGTGFLIEAQNVAALPDQFHLSTPAEDATYLVRVAWRKGDQLGLAIVEG